jgi:hypothetical protein
MALTRWLTNERIRRLECPNRQLERDRDEYRPDLVHPHHHREYDREFYDHEREHREYREHSRDHRDYRDWDRERERERERAPLTPPSAHSSSAYSSASGGTRSPTAHSSSAYRSESNGRHYQYMDEHALAAPGYARSHSRERYYADEQRYGSRSRAVAPVAPVAPADDYYRRAYEREYERRRDYQAYHEMRDRELYERELQDRRAAEARYRRPEEYYDKEREIERHRYMSTNRHHPYPAPSSRY